jgi:hypothetical protein
MRSPPPTGRAATSFAALVTVVALALSPLPAAGAPVGARYSRTPFSASALRLSPPDWAARQGSSAPLVATFTAGNVTTVPLPAAQPGQARQQTTSLLVYNSSFTDEIAGAAKECLAVATGTVPAQWGLWSVRQFAADMIQVEYFCNLPDRVSDGHFSAGLADYLSAKTTGGMTDCLRRKDVGFAYGKVFLGREPEDRDDLPFSSVQDGKGSPSWIPAVIIGVGGLVCLLGVLVLVRQKAGKKYDPSEYTTMQGDPAPVPTVDDELRMLAGTGK